MIPVVVGYLHDCIYYDTYYIKCGCIYTLYLSNLSGDGSSASQQSEEPRSPQAMAQAVRVHDEANKVMYFA